MFSGCIAVSEKTGDAALSFRTQQNGRGGIPNPDPTQSISCRPPSPKLVYFFSLPRITAAAPDKRPARTPWTTFNSSLNPELKHVLDMTHTCKRAQAQRTPAAPVRLTFFAAARCALSANSV